MSSLPRRLLAGVAAVCATAAASYAVPEATARDFLREAESLASRHTRCPSTADDLVGRTALKLLSRHEEVLREKDAPGRSGYIHRCIENEHRDDMRRRSRIRPVSELGDDGQHAFESCATDDVASELEVEEFRSLLSPADREVLELVEEGSKERRIANRTGRTRHGVRCSMERIRRAAEIYFR